MVRNVKRGIEAHVVWFKRDLRTADHAPLTAAINAVRGRANATVLGLFVIEPEVLAAEEYALRHWEATAEALAGLRVALHDLGVPLVVRRGEVVAVLERCRAAYAGNAGALHLWSHEETGNALTYARDRAVLRWSRSRGVAWTEFPTGGVVRRLRTRDGWARQWEERMATPSLPVPPAVAQMPRAMRDEGVIPTALEAGVNGLACPRRQTATRAETLRSLTTFLEYRGFNYNREMSSPRTASGSCSRLSAGLAYGVVSLREVVHAARQREALLRERRAAGEPDGMRVGALRAFLARLHWHCHFIQKLESEPRIEFTAFVPVLDDLREGPWDEVRSARLVAWSEGRTGYPFIDACMRCLQETGWINFRMRAMLVSFASYDLWLPWRQSGLALARLFTDYEPGIHWPQVQMQSGTTGINTLRMYSPVKQSRDQDPGGDFIRTWVPELAGVPLAFVHEPWLMPTAVADVAGVRVGKDYPRPIVDHAEAVRHARAAFSRVRRAPEMRAKSQDVFVRHGSRRRPGTAIVEPRWFEGKGADDVAPRQLDLNV